MPRQLHTLMRKALAAHQAHQSADTKYVDDPMLSEAGNRAARIRHNQAAAAALDRAIAETMEAASSTAAKKVFETAAELRPYFDPNNPAAAIITAQAWQFGVLPRLERGERLSDVLKNADADTVLGAERFAAGYLSGPRDSGVNGHNYDASDEVRRAVTARFMELASTPAAAAAIDEAEHFYDDLETLNRVTQLLRRGDGLSAVEAATLVGLAITGGAAEQAAPAERAAADQAAPADEATPAPASGPAPEVGVNAA